MPAKTITPARRGKRVSGKARDEAGAKAVGLYNGGKSVRDVRDEIGWSYGATHRLLREYGAVMRERGTPGRPRSRS